MTRFFARRGQAKRNFLLVLILLVVGFEVWMLSSVEEAGRLPGDSAMAAGAIGLAGVAAMAFNLVVLLPSYAVLRKRNKPSCRIRRYWLRRSCRLWHCCRDMRRENGLPASDRRTTRQD